MEFWLSHISADWHSVTKDIKKEKRKQKLWSIEYWLRLNNVLVSNRRNWRGWRSSFNLIVVCRSDIQALVLWIWTSCYWKGGENSPATDIQLSFILEKELDYSPICWDWYVVTRLTIQQVSCLITKSFWMLAVTCYVFFGFFCHFCLVFMKMFYCIPVLMQLKIYRTVFT